MEFVELAVSAFCCDALPTHICHSWYRLLWLLVLAASCARDPVPGLRAALRCADAPSEPTRSLRMCVFVY